MFETNFGLFHTPDRTKANMRAFMWDQMKDWLLHGAIEKDEKMAADLAGPGYHINRSNLLVLESKADMQKRGEASPGRRRRPGADLRAARGAGGSQRRGRGGGIRPVHRQQQLGVDAMRRSGACTANRWPPWSRWHGSLNGLPRISMGVRFA
jgi:hypothetical protein